MKFYDITHPLSPSTPEWPGDQKFERSERKTSAIVSRLVLSSHFGTHIDAPKHFLFTKASVDKLQPSSLIGIYKVIAISDPQFITLKELKKHPIGKGDRILFKTRNSKINSKKFTTNYVSLALDSAEHLAQKKVLLVGTDYFGIEAKSAPGHPVHKTLLSKGIVIVEGLYLHDTPPGTYDGAILPLKITGSDGAPARAVLWKH